VGVGLSLPPIFLKKNMSKVTIFMRKDVRKGIHTTTFKDKELKFQDREMQSFENKDEINFLKKDVELVVYVPEFQEEIPKMYKEMNIEQLQKIAGDRDFDIIGLKKKEIIKLLETEDEINSDPKNDQGEQDID